MSATGRVQEDETMENREAIQLKSGYGHLRELVVDMMFHA